MSSEVKPFQVVKKTLVTKNSGIIIPLVDTRLHCYYLFVYLSLIFSAITQGSKTISKNFFKFILIGAQFR